MPGGIEPEYGNVFYGKVKRKANNTRKLGGGKLKAKAKRVAAGSTEVMVKISGFGNGSGHAAANIDYISRNGKAEMETERGEIISGFHEIKEFSHDWVKSFGEDRQYKNRRDTLQMVLSMPEGTPPEAVLNATRGFAKETFSQNHEYVFVLHTDTQQPHCHLTVKTKGFNGKRMNPNRDDLQQWRETFAEKLRNHGVYAEASPRVSRGVIKKHEKSEVRHIAKRKIPSVTASQIKQAAQELAASAEGKPAKEKPWTKAIEMRIAEVKTAWLNAADILEKAGEKFTNMTGLNNARPDYTRIRNNPTIRAVQRAAALYQPNTVETAKESIATAYASLRNLPRGNVVSHNRHVEMLLRKDALNHMGWDRTAHPAMRRKGTGLDGIGPGARERLDREPYVNQASTTRELVRDMPEMETRNEEIKKRLAQQFTVKATTAKQAGKDQVENRSSELRMTRNNDRQDKDVER